MNNCKHYTQPSVGFNNINTSFNVQYGEKYYTQAHKTHRRAADSSRRHKVNNNHQRWHLLWETLSIRNAFPTTPWRLYESSLADIFSYLTMICHLVNALRLHLTQEEKSQRTLLYGWWFISGLCLGLCYLMKNKIEVISTQESRGKTYKQTHWFLCGHICLTSNRIHHEHEYKCLNSDAANMSRSWPLYTRWIKWQ